MLVVETIREEHFMIEQELNEIETILESEEINYSNLIHVLKKLGILWEGHFRREQEIFLTLESRGVKTPITILIHEQAVLKRYLRNIVDAINSGSDFKTRNVLKDDGQMFISKIRKHIQEQEWIFYALPELEVENFMVNSERSSNMIVGN